MKKNPAFHVICPFAIVSWLLFGGCFGRTPPVRYYSLLPLSVSTAEVGLPQEIGIVVGPVSIPEILSRPQIVTLHSRNGVQVSQYERWTGQLQNEIAAILAENISALSGSDRIIPYSRENVFQPDYRLAISINHLDIKMSEEIRLDATWSIKEAKTGRALLVRKSFFQEPLTSDSYDEMVQAQSRILATFSRELARELSKRIGNQ